MKRVKQHWAEALLILVAAASLVVVITFPFRPCPLVDLTVETNSTVPDGPSDPRSLQGLQAKVRQLGPEAVSYVFSQVRQGSVSFATAAGSLAVLGPVAVPALIKGMDDRSDAVRLVATRTVISLRISGQLEPEADRLVPALTKRLHDRRPEIRYCAILALLNLGPKTAPAVPIFIGMLRETNGLSQVDLVCIQQGAAYALGQIGPRAKSAIPALTQLLNEEGSYARQAAGVALWRITHDTNLLLPILSGMLIEPDSSARYQAVGVLHCIGRETELSADLITQAESAKSQSDSFDSSNVDRLYCDQ